MGGNFPLKLNIVSRPIANKYREGKMKRTLERELKVPENADREANGTSFPFVRLFLALAWDVSHKWMSTQVGCLEKVCRRYGSQWVQ